ncbi:MarR family winged helix-turn-helix transcriptional regulator [Paenibacillus sp. FSL R7-0331]|uniref:MarR family winged helix-turn-helix transcriptional regulator n=1 Tax=Paenibacillus sp. FSL R7-0331 TaxID=1536773 RepID=UPI0004F91A9D|nr:MarR family transcriptional regulator [Paenibacillus sp. FSL R7-0331]AIQ52719.1 MarR family transcriptional regulator [Paenibacillus sp. FSL R7-0331]
MNCSMEQEAVLYLLKKMGNELSPKFERCTGIGSSRYDLLYQLYLADEVTQSDLQKAIHIDSAAITRHLKQLEAEGMVTRRRNPEDQRVTFVRLTEECRSLIINFNKERTQFIQQLLNGFSEQETNLLTDMLTRLHHNLKDL